MKDENVCNSALAAHAKKISVIGLVGLAIQQPVNSQFVKFALHDKSKTAAREPKD